MKNVILHLPRWLTESPTHLTATTIAASITTAAATSDNDCCDGDGDETSNAQRTKVTVLFFITGNPGLIGYYGQFLALLTQGRKGGESVIAGASLDGFSVDGNECSTTVNDDGGSDAERSADEEIERQLSFPDGVQKKAIYDLRDQIDLSYRRLCVLVGNLREKFDMVRDASFEVILAGHSVGAYIALELVRLHYEKSTTKPETRPTTTVVAEFDILATFLLTPTIHNISQSPSGRIATPILSYLPFFPLLIQFGASSLSTVLPQSWLRSIVQRVTGMRNSDAVETTTEFLCTPGAVKQALYLAACEMREIGKDRWTEEVWGAMGDATAEDDKKVHNRWLAPRHFFLFAKEDQWIADATREAIADKMRQRAVVHVDGEGILGLNHAWCLQHNEVVADIVNGWIDEVIRVTSL